MRIKKHNQGILWPRVETVISGKPLIGPYYHNQHVILNYTSGETEQFCMCIYSFSYIHKLF